MVATPRWYSTETETATKEAPAKEAEDKPKTEGGPGLTEAESELAKNLEAKEKEALDWKVRRLPLASRQRP